MMINKRLINTISESKKYIAANVALQWLSLAANIVMMTAVTWFLAGLFTKEDSDNAFGITLTAVLCAPFDTSSFIISIKRSSDILLPKPSWLMS